MWPGRCGQRISLHRVDQSTTFRTGIAGFADTSGSSGRATPTGPRRLNQWVLALLLTDRELDMARVMRDGLPNRQIAAKLFVSRKTVETHLHHVFRKLGVTTRMEAARIVGLWARQRGRIS